MAVTKKEKLNLSCTCEGVVQANFIKDISFNDPDTKQKKQFQLYHCLNCNKFRGWSEDDMEKYLSLITDKTAKAQIKLPTKRQAK